MSFRSDGRGASGAGSESPGSRPHRHSWPPVFPHRISRTVSPQHVFVATTWQQEVSTHSSACDAPNTTAGSASC